MRMHLALLLACLWISPTLAQGISADADVNDLEERARQIHQQVMTLDTHVDIPVSFATGNVDPASRPGAQVDLDKMAAGGLDAAFFIVYVGQLFRTPENYARVRRDALAKFDAIHRMTDDLYPERIGLATTASEAMTLHEQGKLVALIGIENGFAMGQDLTVLEDFRRRGARYMTLVHNGHNDIGDSAQPRPQFGDSATEHGGLSDFGNLVVDELNRLGILVDVSHVSRQTMLDATRRSRAPVIASHSSVTGVASHPRNMDDEQLLALRDNGGVVHIVAFGGYVKPVPTARIAALDALQAQFGIGPGSPRASLSPADQDRYQARIDEINATWPAASVSDFVDHIDYAVNLIGIDHVGISSDFGGGGGVTGWDDATETFNITMELVRRGYSARDIGLLWSGNLLRILAEAESIAADLD